MSYQNWLNHELISEMFPVHVLHVLSCALFVSTGVLATFAPSVYAIGPVGQIGPRANIGQQQSIDATDSATSAKVTQTPAHDLPEQRLRTSPGESRQGNLIVVTGNSATNVRCPDGGSVSVNSVNVDAASLKGRTIIVQGRNVRGDIQAECDPKNDGTAVNTPPSSINSVNIR